MIGWYDDFATYKGRIAFHSVISKSDFKRSSFAPNYKFNTVRFQRYGNLSSTSCFVPSSCFNDIDATDNYMERSL